MVITLAKILKVWLGVHSFRTLTEGGESWIEVEEIS